LATIEGVARGALASAKEGCAVQVPCLIEDQITERHIAVLAALKTVEHLFLPGIALLGRWRKLVHRATTNRRAQQQAWPTPAVAGYAIEVPGLIDNQPALGRRAVVVGMALEDVENGLGPRSALLCWRLELIYRAALTRPVACRRASISGCAVEVAGLVKHHTASGDGSVGNALKAVQDFLLPLRRGG
jgi:hypothetical protein